MKKILPFLLLLLSVAAQAQVKYGSLHYDSILQAMPDYELVQTKMQQLRAQYEAEATYNETSFRRSFVEFLQGQKDFPQSIMLKRQRDLQEEMERGLAFRNEADSLLKSAEAEMMQPLHRRLNAAIVEVGLERGYECIVNLDERVFPFLHPQLCEDATPFVWKKLRGE